MSRKAHDPPNDQSPHRDAKDLYLHALDRRAKPGPGTDRRAHERLPLRCSDGLEVLIETIDGQPLTYRVRPRNLSQGGIAFLHEAYVYPETRCTIVLISLTGQPIEVSGKVVGCRHVTGKLHEIALVFDRPIKPTDFLDCIYEAMGSPEL